MKKHTLFIICAFFNCTILFAGHTKMSRNTHYPSFKTVVVKYFENYAEPDENKTLIFTKNPDGWHAVIKVYNNNGEMTVIADELFWSRKKKEFLSIKFPHKTKEASEEIINKYSESTDGSYDFSIDPYYGYIGWDWDVIKEYGRMQNLSDTLLEALARAYRSYTYNLLDNLLMWGRSQADRIPFDPQKLNLAYICKDVLEVLNPNAIAKNITINYSEANGLTIFADINMMKTILRNLISNAIKFTNKNGAINISARKTNSNITISVSDNGVRIKNEDMTRLFDMSGIISTKGTSQETGTGLG